MAALANEKGGRLVFGMKDKRPHDVVGSNYEVGNLGALEDAIYKKMGIRVRTEYAGKMRIGTRMTQYLNVMV